MNKYNYDIDLSTGLVYRSLVTVYPDVQQALTKLDEGATANIVINALKSVFKGVAEKPYIELEDSWWTSVSTIQDLESKLSYIAELVNTEIVDTTGIATPLTQEELDTNQDKLSSLLRDAGYGTVDDYITYLNNELATNITARDELENSSINNIPNEWLKTFRGIDNIITTRPDPIGVIPKQYLKMVIAKERDVHIRSAEDSIADLAKMNSLLFGMTAALYGVTSTTAKNKLPAAQRGIIEHAIAKYHQVNTRADNQLLLEGTALIDRLFDREANISTLVDNIMSNGS